MKNHDLSKLTTELKFFNAKKDEWLKHYENKFALIKGEKLCNTFTTIEEAYQEGVMLFGLEPFLVKQIVREEPTEELPALFANAINARL